MPPFTLSLYWMCQTYRALPEAGGLLDQDINLIQLMNLCNAAYTTSKKALKDFKQEDVRLEEWLR